LLQSSKDDFSYDTGVSTPVGLSDYYSFERMNQPRRKGD